MSQKYGYVHPTKTAGSELRLLFDSTLNMVPSLGRGPVEHTPLSEQYDEDIVWIGSVRHPYTRLYSIYNFFSEHWKDLDFISFCLDLERISKLKGEAENLVLPSFEVLSADDTLGVDHIIRFENLDEDIKKLSNALGLKVPLRMPPGTQVYIYALPREATQGPPNTKATTEEEIFAHTDLEEIPPHLHYVRGRDTLWIKRAYKNQNINRSHLENKAQFTRESLDIINKVFDKDFETFGYNKI